MIFGQPIEIAYIFECLAKAIGSTLSTLITVLIRLSWPSV